MKREDQELNARTTITPAFNAVARDDFAAMIETKREIVKPVKAARR